MPKATDRNSLTVSLPLSVNVTDTKLRHYNNLYVCWPCFAWAVYKNLYYYILLLLLNFVFISLIPYFLIWPIYTTIHDSWKLRGDQCINFQESQVKSFETHFRRKACCYDNRKPTNSGNTDP
eukprot:sb/3475953/